MQAVLAEDAHHEKGGVKVQGPLILATRRYRRDAGRLDLFDGFDEVVPLFDLGRIDASLLAQVFVIPKDHWCEIVGHSVGFAVDDEILRGRRIKSLVKPSLANLVGDVFADSRGDLFIHHSTAPTMKGARAILGL